MATPPVMELPSNPSDNAGHHILGATLTCTSLAFIVICLRLYVRLATIRSFGWDDALMTFAMSLAIAGQAIIGLQIKNGGGQHAGDVEPPVYRVGMMYNFITQPTYLITICIVKLAVGASLLRIATTKFYRVLILFIMGFMAFYTIGCFFTLMFQCTDIRILWDTRITATCWNQTTLQGLSYTNVALNILTDLLLAVFIPAPMLWSLNVNNRTRASIICVLGLGVFSCAAAIVKVPYLTNYGKQGDFLWDSRNITIWTVAETTVGIIAGSMPAIRPLFKTILGSVYGSGSRYQRKYGDGVNTTTGGAGSQYHSGTAGRNRVSSLHNHHHRRLDKSWQTLSAVPPPIKRGPGRREPGGMTTVVIPDETSSEREINIGDDRMVTPDEYEMITGQGVYRHQHHHHHGKYEGSTGDITVAVETSSMNTTTTDTTPRSSDDSIGGGNDFGGARDARSPEPLGGILRTLTTQVDYSSR